MLYETNGRLVGSVNPFWSISAVSLSPDGNWLAIAQEFDRPIWTPHRAKVWIYSTKNLLVPALRIEEIDVLRVTRIRFSEDASQIFIESRNSRVVLGYEVDLVRAGNF